LIKYKIAAKYAKALLETAKEINIADQIYNDLETIADVFKNSQDFKIIMVGALIGKSEKKGIIAILAEKYKFNRIVVNFLNMLIDRSKIKFLPVIFDKYSSLYKEDKGIISATIISAVKLDQTILSNIKSKLSLKLNKQLELSEKVNPEILGGVIIKTEGVTFNSSLRMKLNNLKENILKG